MRAPRPICRRRMPRAPRNAQAAVMSANRFASSSATTGSAPRRAIAMGAGSPTASSRQGPGAVHELADDGKHQQRSRGAIPTALRQVSMNACKQTSGEPPPPRRAAVKRAKSVSPVPARANRGSALICDEDAVVPAYPKWIGEASSGPTVPYLALAPGRAPGRDLAPGMGRQDPGGVRGKGEPWQR